MKKFMTMLCAVLACSFLFTVTPVQAKTAEYEMTLTKNYQRFWSNGTTKIYLKDTRNDDQEIIKQKLYRKNIKSGKVTLLKTLIPNLDNDEYYNICNVYGNNIYLNKTKGVGDGDLYTYNMKTKKFKCVKKNFQVLNASGKYLITSTYTPTDIAPFPEYLYKINSKGIEKIKTLGKYTSQSQFAKDDGRLYYAKYDKGSDMHKLSIYSCKKDGSNLVEELKIKTASRSDCVILQDVTKDAITYVVQNEDQQYYRYDRSTKETTKISDPYEQ